MTREEAIERLKEARSTIQPFRYVDEAIDYAIKALKQKLCDDTVSRGVFEQVMWERDTAIEQLRELGYDLGQKIEPCDDCVSRQALLRKLNTKTHEYSNGMGFRKEWVELINSLSPVIPKREQGKWIQNGTGYDDEPIYKCSQCGKRVTFWEDGSFNGCPYCFAEMKGVKE